MKKVIIALALLLITGLTVTGCICNCWRHRSQVHTVTLVAPSQVELFVTLRAGEHILLLELGENFVEEGTELAVFFEVNPLYFAYLYINNVRQENVTMTIVIEAETVIEVKVERQ